MAHLCSNHVGILGCEVWRPLTHALQRCLPRSVVPMRLLLAFPSHLGTYARHSQNYSLVSRFKGVPTRSGLKHCSGLGTDKLWRAGVLGAGHSCCNRSNLRVVANGQVNDSVLAGTRMGPVCWSA